MGLFSNTRAVETLGIFREYANGADYAVPAGKRVLAVEVTETDGLERVTVTFEDKPTVETRLGSVIINRD